MPSEKNILITGSVAIDNIKTPYGEVNEVLGGSATYSSFAASLFSSVKVVSMVGSDFPADYLKKFTDRKIDISGLKIFEGQTFRWTGLYAENMNEAKTLSVCPENLKDASFNIPSHYKNSDYIFLANTDPDVQSEILERISVSGPVLMDTMNLWINSKPESIKKLLEKIDIMLINETEARLFTGKINLISAAREISKMGPGTVVIKKGEHGALMFMEGDIFSVPAYPVEEVKDPTGAGDSFAGGFTGYLAFCGKKDNYALRRAAVTGAAVASFTVEDFSTKRLESITQADISVRVEKIRQMLKF
ncbi:MAG TPA: PfkB family carbohydrate kinase [bacterium]|nr:PfkB family carbohydrate kinase [bacterium]